MPNLVKLEDGHVSVKAASPNIINKRWRREPLFFAYIEPGSILVLRRAQPSLSFDLRSRESFTCKDFFYSVSVIPLQFNETIFHSPSTCKSCFEVARELFEIDFVGIDSLDHGDLLSVAPFVHFYGYSLLFFSYFFTDAQLARESANGTHSRAHAFLETSDFSVCTCLGRQII
jgi:hypothetical protein